jgi:hypothetical protein
MTHKQTLALAFGFLLLFLLSAANVYFELGFLPHFARAMMGVSLMFGVLFAIRDSLSISLPVGIRRWTCVDIPEHPSTLADA